MRPNDKAGHIFLNQGVVTEQNHGSVAVIQMMSERHDANANWLIEWIRGAPVPKEVVSDLSLAILGAPVKAFTPNPDIKTYLNEWFPVRLGNPSAPNFHRVTSELMLLTVSKLSVSGTICKRNHTILKISLLDL